MTELEQTAHMLFIERYQAHINVDPPDFKATIHDLHPSVYNMLSDSERDLWGALLRAEKSPNTR